ncbi:MAG: HK97 family phage prohead protease [Hyphomicrobiales bacterium]|nr:MAG: HK97 family phage prohead protease [Hyphomicrobiales bacterium]
MSFSNLEIKFAAAQLAMVDGDGIFSGYASLFDKVDLGQDKIAPGAFAKTLGERGISGIKMLFQHDPNEIIGTWLDIREDAHGLMVRGKLAANVARADEVRALMQAGALDGLSIGFKTIKSRKDQKSGVRTLMQLDLWEISVVTFPMLPEARVGAIADQKQRPSIREFERWLTRDAGLTRREANTVIHSGFKAMSGSRDAATAPMPNLAALHGQLKRATTLLHNSR